MTRLILAGVAALALSTGAAFAANTAQPVADYGNAPAQSTQAGQHYDYYSQQSNAASYLAHTQRRYWPGEVGGFTNFDGPTPFGSSGNG